jgi:hypothetical protein
MPQFNKSPKTLEIGQLFDPDASDSPVAHIFSEIQKRKQLQDVLAQALAKMGLAQFTNEISLGEITLEGEIKLITQKAGILTKLKNKLPSLLNYFRESGFPLKAIQLKVSPRSTSVELHENMIPEVFTPVPLSASQIKAWQTLLSEIDPDSPVYEAVQNLLKNTS